VKLSHGLVLFSAVNRSRGVQWRVSWRLLGFQNQGADRQDCRHYWWFQSVPPNYPSFKVSCRDRRLDSVSVAWPYVLRAVGVPIGSRRSSMVDTANDLMAQAAAAAGKQLVVPIDSVRCAASFPTALLNCNSRWVDLESNWCAGECHNKKGRNAGGRYRTACGVALARAHTSPIRDVV
jgi:hypothetical protein